MTTHPYKTAPTRAFWKRSVSGQPPAEIDLVAGIEQRIDRSSRVMSAGSCFAANIARYLVSAGYNYLVTEDLHPAISSLNPPWYRKLGYGVYSAHYGNVYTARQMLQLLMRAYGEFRPEEDCWIEGEGTFVDPFRPTFPHPATSEREYEALRAQHFAAVRAAVEQADIVVFTLGLTEAWRSTRDGAVYPVCPGVSGGDFDRSRHEFVNFTVQDVAADLEAITAFLKRVNPAAHLVLTVSPVPLAATATGDHVVSATIYSKSVLRVAAEMARQRLGATYFPSYEIITGPQAPADYFEPDRRAVSERGVEHVMRLFFRHLMRDGAGEAARRDSPTQTASQRLTSIVAAATQAACDEELLELRS